MQFVNVLFSLSLWKALSSLETCNLWLCCFFYFSRDLKLFDIITPRVCAQALREDVGRQMERERELQQRYGELLMEREALLNSAQKYWATHTGQTFTETRSTQIVIAKTLTLKQLLWESNDFLLFSSIISLVEPLSFLRYSEKCHDVASVCLCCCDVTRWVLSMLISTLCFCISNQ